MDDSDQTIPPWQPIGDWDGEEFIVMAFKTIFGGWVTTNSHYIATHFMCLPLPEKEQDK